MELTKEELLILEDLENISFSIKKIYTKLFNLDFKHQKDNQNYAKYLDYLKMCVEEEAKVYNKCSLNIIKNIKLYLSMNDTIDELIINRILNRLEQIEKYNFNNYIYLLSNDEQMEILDECSNDYVIYLEEYFKSEFLCKDLLRKQLYVEYLRILYKELPNVDTNIYKGLFQSKYKYSYEIPVLEEIFIKNEFDINNLMLNPCINHLEEYQLQDVDYYKYRHDEVLEEVKQLIKDFLNDKNMTKNKKLFFYNQIFFRAYLQLLDKYHINEVLDFYEKYINSKKYKQKNPDNKIIEELVTQLINMVYKDEQDKHLISSIEMTNKERQILKKLKH